MAWATTLRSDETTPALIGKIDGSTYVSPTGMFVVEIPVLPELGGRVIDTANIVTFQDDFNVHESIGCFPMDAFQRWEHDTQGRKDYLAWFFSNYVQADFQRRFPGAKIENAHYLPTLRDGALVVYNLLPDGSMFSAKAAVIPGEDPPMAKRGTLLLVKDQHILVLSIELAERVLERSTYRKTPAEEDALLRNRLIELLNKISFTAPAPVSTARIRG